MTLREEFKEETYKDIFLDGTRMFTCEYVDWLENRVKPKVEDYFIELDGKEYCDEELALSRLLEDDVILANCRDYTFQGEKAGTTTILFVISSDVFVWGCADADDLPHKEIGTLLKMHLTEPYGVIKWLCLKRNEKPQDPIVENMKKDGAWDDQMEALPDNYYWTSLKEKKEKDNENSTADCGNSTFQRLRRLFGGWMGKG